LQGGVPFIGIARFSPRDELSSVELLPDEDPVGLLQAPAEGSERLNDSRHRGAGIKSAENTHAASSRGLITRVVDVDQTHPVVGYAIAW
jgi:hypothetical protein